MIDELVVRTDHGDGEQTLVSWERARKNIESCYEKAEPVMRMLMKGHPIRCIMATYQHRDFVPGFERES